jgi:hypothetical protein
VAHRQLGFADAVGAVSAVVVVVAIFRAPP